MWKSPSTLIPGFTNLFHDQRQQQQQLITTSLIQKQVNDTRIVMEKNIEKVMSRGQELNHLQDQTEELLHSSEIFKMQTMKWHQRWFYYIKTCQCVPQWWFFCWEKKISD